MASLGHVLVGLALARAHQRHAPLTPGAAPATLWPRALALSALSMLPDGDVIAFPLGIPYAHELGHRGASHSLAFALVVGPIAGLWLARAWRAHAWSTVLVATLAVVSHPLLDMLTDGGLGCAFWWPVSAARHFFDVQPIPVAPIGPAFLSARGLHCMLVELALLSPCVVYLALARPRRASAPRPPSPAAI